MGHVLQIPAYLDLTVIKPKQLGKSPLLAHWKRSKLLVSNKKKQQPTMSWGESSVMFPLILLKS